LGDLRSAFCGHNWGEFIQVFPKWSGTPRPYVAIMRHIRERIVNNFAICVDPHLQSQLTTA